MRSEATKHLFNKLPEAADLAEEFRCLSETQTGLRKMALPGNGLLVVNSEAALLVTALRRSARWGSHSFPTEEYDVLMRMFRDLQAVLASVDDLRILDPTTYLAPFLELVRSKETTGPVTSLALSAINKFLAYGLIDPTHRSVPVAVEDIADAVTHARFVGTDPSSDGVVLLKMLQVLRTLMLSPEGAMLTDESVCEIMLSCFRIAFETRLNELLRRNAEHCLRDMTQLIFMRLPQFSAEGAGVNCSVGATVGLSLRRKERTGNKRALTHGLGTNLLERGMSLGGQNTTFTEKETQEKAVDTKANASATSGNEVTEADITIEVPKNPESIPEVTEDITRSPTKKHARHSSMDLASIGNTSITQLLEKCVTHSDSTDDEPNVPTEPEIQESTEEETIQNESDPLLESTEVPDETEEGKDTKDEKMEEYVNPRGIRFTQQEDSVNLQPYGLICVRELFRFLISLCNPLDQQNTPAMIHLGLSLVETSLEVGADHLAKYQSLLNLVKDPLCRNLFNLLNSDRISIFALDLQVSFLLFESMRHHLKLQMESFFKRIIDIISSDVTKATYEMKEITHLALESLAQMFRIPGLCTELYLNYDCDIYCTNLFEDLTKLLSKHAVSSTAYNTHSLSLDALMTIVEAIESTSNNRTITLSQNTKSEDAASEEKLDDTAYGRGGHVSLELGGLDDASVVSDHVTHDISQYLAGVRIGRHITASEVPSESEIENIKKRKECIATGTEMFNQKPERGIDYLIEHGILKTPLDPHEVAMFLRENPSLDKKMIGDYICKRSKGDDDGGPSVLAAFANSFEFSGLRIEQALRLYLETFRLPGEAPLIFLVMEHFAERWHTCNGSPFANTDAAFRLAYAVIMLNMDQHNHNAKKLNVPMNAEDFVKNLRGCNGNGDFQQSMLEAVFNSIKGEEMVMPAEHTGIVRENYLWKVLLRRGALTRYLAAAPGALDDRLFDIAWGPTVTALSSAFERAPVPTPEELEKRNPRESAAARALTGLEQCAAIVAARRQHGDKAPVTLDTLVLSVCKFTGLLTIPENASYISVGVALGQSTKGQLALGRACAMLARHADCVRDAWRHLLEILRTLYIGRLLPKTLVEAEDFTTESGKVSLIREPSNRSSEASLLSSLYSYIALGESVAYRAPTIAEKTYIDLAVDCVNKCNLPAVLLTETKFLQLESLQELVKQLALASAPPDPESLQLNPQLEDIMVFFMELLTKITVQNRDRVLHIWPEVSSVLTETLRWGAARDPHGSYAAERALTALLKTAVRLMRNEECAPTVLQSLNSLTCLPYRVFYRQAHRISSGLYELVKTSAQNVHSAEDWSCVLGLIAAAGAGAWREDDALSTPSTASSRSEGSEDESSMEPRPVTVSSDSELSHSPHTQGWILVKNETGTESSNSYAWDIESVRLRAHRPAALARCTEALALVVRDVAHVTPYNFSATVRTARLLVQASIDGGKKASIKSSESGQRKSRHARRKKHEDHSDDEEGSLDQYHMVSIQLLDLMHTLHSRTAQIFRWWREEAGLPHHNHVQGDEEYDLWEVAWMPLLQGIAKLCTDTRKQVANSAVAYLQRALLAPGLQALGGAGWECCFQRVLFPLVEQLTRVTSRVELTARADTIVCKVFLHHLSALSTRPSFPALWLRVVALQRSLVAPPQSQGAPAVADDALREAALESLKNMILVMDSVKIFADADGYNELWHVTWDKIAQFLPRLKEELFPHLAEDKSVPPPHPAPPAGLPTLVPVGTVKPSAATVPSVVRNPLYLPPAPHSSVLLQPLSQMVSTPIGIAIPTQQQMPQGFPVLYPNLTPDVPQPMSNQYRHIDILEHSSPTPSFTLVGRNNQEQRKRPDIPTTQSVQHTEPPTRREIDEPSETQLKENVQCIDSPPLNSPMSTSNIAIHIGDDFEPEIKTVERSELYTEYLTNPYNDTKELSPKEQIPYKPEVNDSRTSLDNQIIVNPESLLSDPIIEKQKSLSVDCSPMHAKVQNQFSSTDNIQNQSSGMFNFSSYFGLGSREIPPGSEILFGDTCIPPQEG